MSRAIDVEHLSKVYRLGAAGSVSLQDAVAGWWTRVRRVEDGSSSTPGGRALRGGDGEFRALDDVSLRIDEGEVIGIIGANGAGKSTLLKILSQITAPTAGEVRIYGRIASLLEVGTGFHPDLSGRDNVFLNGAIMGMTKAEIGRKFEEIVAFSECEAFIDTPVKRYSSGMYVRLAFAVAAHLEPEILIVDEVLAVGDAQFQRKCLGKMGDVARHGRTVLFVSHSMAAVQQLTSRAVLLDHGRIRADGPTRDVVARYVGEGQQAGANYCDVEDVPRPFADNSMEVRFCSLELVSHPTCIVGPDESLEVACVLAARNAVEGFHISLTVFRADGTPVGSSFGADTLSLDAGERGRFRVLIENPRLAPGTYVFGFGVGRGNETRGHADFDVVLHVLLFEVEAPLAAAGIRSYWTPNWGPIRLRPPETTRET